MELLSHLVLDCIKVWHARLAYLIILHPQTMSVKHQKAMKLVKCPLRVCVHATKSLKLLPASSPSLLIWRYLMGVHIEVDHQHMCDVKTCDCNEKRLIILHILEFTWIRLYEVPEAVQPQNSSSSKVSPRVNSLKTYCFPLVRFQLLRQGITPLIEHFNIEFFQNILHNITKKHLLPRVFRYFHRIVLSCLR